MVVRIVVGVLVVVGAIAFCCGRTRFPLRMDVVGLGRKLVNEFTSRHGKMRSKHAVAEALGRMCLSIIGVDGLIDRQCRIPARL